MTFDKIIVTIFGFLLAAFVYWFFLMKKDRADREDHGSHH